MDLPEPKPHPTKEIFKAHGIRQIRIALACGCTYGHINSVLNGVYNPSDELDAKLHKLAAELEADN